MATLYGTYATNRDVTVPSVKNPAFAQHGRVRSMYDTYTSTGVIALNDVIELGLIPAGAKVIGFSMMFSDFGTTGTFDLGWEASADAVESASATGFLSAVDVNTAAGVINETDTGTTAPTGLFKTFSSQVRAKITASQATTAAGTVHVCIQYVVD